VGAREVPEGSEQAVRPRARVRIVAVSF